MELNDAIMVIDCNYQCSENSFIYDLHEKNIFCIQHFWEYYDSIIVLAKEALTKGRSMETAMKITFVYQSILKEIIYHFDKQDMTHIKQFPVHYAEYIERLDGALDAYYRGVFIKDEIYSLKR